MSVEVLEKALWLRKVGELWVVGREEADSHYHHVAEPNPFSPLLFSPALCEEWVWPGAHVQIWVLVIGLLPTVAKVKLLCALCCCFLRVTVVFCSSLQSHVSLLQLEGTVVWVVFGRRLFISGFELGFLEFILAALYNLSILYSILNSLLSSVFWSCLNYIVLPVFRNNIILQSLTAGVFR